MFEKREPNFCRNDALESLLLQINADLQFSEQKLVSQHMNMPMRYPLILVMGPLRSGTTLFMQWLANTGLVAYPSNLLSRFYQAPIIGAKIQLLLTDPRFNFRNELGEFIQQVEYRSENGKTEGVLAPNEFWYFWRRFLAEPERDAWTDDELQQTMDFSTMIAELAGIMNVFQKPFAAKALLFNYNISFLDSIFDKVLFIQLRRDLVSTTASVLEARKRQFGDENKWYSFKIREYKELKDFAPLKQSAGQVYFIKKAIDDSFSKLSESRKLIVDYETFCENPGCIFDLIVNKIGLHDIAYSGSKKFNPMIRSRHPKQEEIIDALSYFHHKYGFEC